MYIHINSNGSRIMAGLAFGIKNVLHFIKIKTWPDAKALRSSRRCLFYHTLPQRFKETGNVSVLSSEKP